MSSSPHRNVFILYNTVQRSMWHIFVHVSEMCQKPHKFEQRHMMESWDEQHRRVLMITAAAFGYTVCLFVCLLGGGEGRGLVQIFVSLGGFRSQEKMIVQIIQ